MSEIARLVVPALRWDRTHGFGYLGGLIDDALERGVGGFLVEGGPKAEVAALIARLHASARHPLLIAVPAERGAGETIAGLTELPPLGAVASVAVVPEEGTGKPYLDAELVRRAARLTARELRTIGANWALAPVCNLDAPGDRSGPGSRGASDDPAVVGAVVAEWVDACQADAVVACALRFSGADIGPFAAAVDAGVASVMIDGPTVSARHHRPPAVRGGVRSGSHGVMASANTIDAMLRDDLGFDGIAATGPLDRDDAVPPGDEPELAVAAVAAGCDIVMAPGNLHGVCGALERAAAAKAFPAGRAHEAIARVDRWAGWARPAAAAEPSLADVLWTRQLADRAVRHVRGARPRVGGSIEVVVVRPASGVGQPPDGLLSPVAITPPANITPFVDVFRSVHVAVTESVAPTHGERAPLAIVFVPRDPTTGAVHADEAAAVHGAARAGTAARRDVVVVVCGHPRGAAALTGHMPPEAAVLCAWGAWQPMLEAAARAFVTVR